MEKSQSQTWTFFGYLFDMDQDQQQTKPRKRFVGKARKQEGTAPDSGNIEDGAVGFASMSAFIVSFCSHASTHMQSRTFSHSEPATRSTASRMANQIPDEVMNNPLLNKMIEQVWT